VLQAALQALAQSTKLKVRGAKVKLHETLDPWGRSVASKARANPVEAANFVSNALRELVQDDKMRLQNGKTIKEVLVEKEALVVREVGGRTVYDFDYAMAEKVILSDPEIRGKFLEKVAGKLGGDYKPGRTISRHVIGVADDVSAEIVSRVGFRYLKLEEYLAGRDFMAGIPHAKVEHDALKRLGNILAEKFSGETGGSVARLLKLYRSDQSFKLKVDAYIRELAEVDKENFGFLQGVDPSKVMRAISELRSMELGMMEKALDWGRGAVKAAPGALASTGVETAKAAVAGSARFSVAIMEATMDAVIANLVPGIGRDFVNAIHSLMPSWRGNQLARVEEQLKAMERAGVQGA